MYPSLSLARALWKPQSPGCESPKARRHVHFNDDDDDATNGRTNVNGSNADRPSRDAGSPDGKAGAEQFDAAYRVPELSLENLVVTLQAGDDPSMQRLVSYLSMRDSEVAKLRKKLVAAKHCTKV